MAKGSTPVITGRVESVDLAPSGWTAEVTLLVNGDVRLPANALAMLRQSSPHWLLPLAAILIQAGTLSTLHAQPFFIPFTFSARSDPSGGSLRALNVNGIAQELRQTIDAEVRAAWQTEKITAAALAQDANTWVKRSPIKSGPPSSGMGYETSLAYDPVHKRVVRWGGHNQGGGGEQNAETWLLDPVTMKWELREPNRSPPGLLCPAERFRSRRRPLPAVPRLQRPAR